MGKKHAAVATDSERQAARRRVATLAVLAVVLLGVVVVLPTLAFAQRDDEAPAALVTSSAALDGASDPSNPAAIELQPNNPEAAEELPHNNLNRSEALDLLQAVFATALEAPADIYSDLDNAQLLSDHVAVVGAEGAPTTGGQQTESSESVLVESTLPLRDENSAGDNRPVDLTLSEVDGELQPVNGLVEIGIPTELGDGIALPEEGIVIDLPGAAAERSPSIVEDSTAFYPSIAPDSDLLVIPSPTGVETQTQLRTADAPYTQSFHLHIPASAELQQAKDGGAEVTRGQDTLMRIPAPTARDAEGIEVPTTLTIAGNSILVTVAPPSSTLYPVLVDPFFETFDWTQYFGTEGHNYNFAMPGWTSYSTTGALWVRNWTVGEFAGHWGTTLVSGDRFTPLNVNDVANWGYIVPKYWSDYQAYSPNIHPTTYIKSVTMLGLEFRFSSYQGAPPSRVASPYFAAGIWDSANNGWISLAARNGVEGQLTEPAKPYVFDNKNSNENAKSFSFNLIASEAAYAPERQVWASQATIELGDKDNPTINSRTAPEKWVDAQPTSKVGFTTTDLGLGVSRLTVEQPSAFGPPKVVETQQGCIGSVTKPCPRYWTPLPECPNSTTTRRPCRTVKTG